MASEGGRRPRDSRGLQRVARQSGARASGEERTSGKQRLLFILIPPVLILALVAGLFLLADRSDAGPELDGDLCPVAAGGIAARALYLVDLQKPLDEGRRTLPGALLRSLTLELGAQTELRVFALTQDSAAPRRLLDRLCKPYGNADLAAEGAKDQGSAIRDCDNLPAQIPQHIRDGATKFCARRGALSERLDRLAERQSIEPVGNAYLIEALEETSLEFAELPPGPRSLHIFSDMMQHAHWYSHAELGWNGWSFNGFQERRQAQDEFVGPRPPAIADAAVTLYYTPRQGVTSLPRAKAVHKNFWRDYFTDAAGTEPRFDEQPTMAAYQSAPLMNQQAEVAEAEQERERLRQEEMQQQLAEMERQQAEMEQARQQAEAEEQEREARMAQLRQEREQLAQEEAERQRAEAAVAEAEAAAAAAAEAEAAIAEAEAQAEAAEQEEAAPPEPAIAQTPPEEEPESEPPAVAQAEPEPPAEQPAPQEAPAAQPEEAAAEAATPAVAEAEPEPPAEEPSLQAPPAVAAEPPAVAASPPPPCGLRLKSSFTNAGDIYPGGHRVDYGAATIVASYVVNERGETEDDQILIDTESSVVGRARNFNLFADEVRNLIGRWEFDFMQPEDGSACTRSQSLSTQFQFQFNRRR